MSGDKAATADSKAIVVLETALAKVQWTNVENRDPVKAYNKFTLLQLNNLAPGYNWYNYFSSAGLYGKIEYVIVSQPSYITGFNEILKSTPLSVWKAYFRWHLLSDYAPYLPKAYIDERFAFYGTALRGVPEIRSRSKRGVSFVEGSVGESLGKFYVAKYFPPENKARMEKLVNNLLEAYRRSIDTLDWMSPETKNEVKAKLAKFRVKIGYPKKWRDYSNLTIVAGDLVGNAMRVNVFEYKRNVSKLGQLIDRDEWGMYPQTVNAYYDPELNEIVFPAAILQPPFFNPEADDAVNYGGIGAIIGHEISHGFDDQGSQYDGDGNLRDWWTKEDHNKFTVKTKSLVAQYSSYEPVKGYHVNGELTLGENIADNSGLAIAFKAYKLSLAQKAAPVIDGLTGEERFYIGFAQIWRSKTRENEEVRRIKTDPHSPGQFRAIGALVNQPGFYDVFGIKKGDKMYLPPEDRISIW
jgi:putative endopeptidase